MARGPICCARASTCCSGSELAQKFLHVPPAPPRASRRLQDDKGPPCAPSLHSRHCGTSATLLRSPPQNKTLLSPSRIQLSLSLSPRRQRPSRRIDGHAIVWRLHTTNKPGRHQRRRLHSKLRRRVWPWRWRSVLLIILNAIRVLLLRLHANIGKRPRQMHARRAPMVRPW